MPSVLGFYIQKSSRGLIPKNILTQRLYELGIFALDLTANLIDSNAILFFVDSESGINDSELREVERHANRVLVLVVTKDRSADTSTVFEKSAKTSVRAIIDTDGITFQNPDNAPTIVAVKALMSMQ